MTTEHSAAVRALLADNVLAVVATNSSSGFPQSAVVALSETEELELIFATFNDTRKFVNLAADQRLSLVVGWNNENKRTLQIEGLARLAEGDEQEWAADIHCAKSVASRRFRDDPRQHYFIVRPVWLRYSDYMAQPKEIWEYNF